MIDNYIRSVHGAYWGVVAGRDGPRPMAVDELIAINRLLRPELRQSVRRIKRLKKARLPPKDL